MDVGEGERVAVSVTLGLTLEEIGADRIDYIVSHPSLLPSPIVGSLDAAIFPKAVGDPPPLTFAMTLYAGTGYELSLSAYEADGDKICDGVSNFDVVASEVTVTAPVLTCRSSESNPVGVIGIDISFQLNVCPVIDLITATPAVDVGETIYFEVTGRDPDNTAPLQYTWSTPSGPVTDPTLASASYTCTAPGVVDLTIELSDGDLACNQVRVVQIACNVCGNSQVEGDEECDDGAAGSAACDVDCTLAVCGDGTLNTAAGETCDDAGQSATCDTDCSPPVCGDALLNSDAGEFCDDGVNDSTGPLGCEPGCAPPGGCGNGLVETGETCDDMGWSPACDTDCTAATCGDGTLNVYAGEICDGAGETGICDTDCTAAVCGDGVINATAGELCDDSGPSAACDADCSLAQCGDALINIAAGEACDDGGASATCDADCTR